MNTPILLPEKGTLSEYYESYRHYISESDLLKAIISQGELTNDFIKSIPETKGDHKYAEGKWSVKEVLGHITDTERILTYRVLCFMRGEQQPLPGFEENDYVRNSNFSSRTLQDISAELYAVRQATIHLLKNMDEKMLDIKGVANGNQVTVRGLIFMVLGHERHHVNFIKKTYLNS